MTTGKRGWKRMTLLLFLCLLALVIAMEQNLSQTLLDMAEGMKKSVPCTGCGYCLNVCPLGLDIPTMLATFNELRFAPVTNTSMLMEFLPAQKQPSACIGCAQCMQMCPQNISIPVHLRELSAILRDMPKWADISRERAEAAKRAAMK